MFVCVFDASCIDSLHVGKVNQGSYYGFNRFTSYSRHFLGIFLMLGKLLMHAVVMFFVDAIVKLFKLGTFATAWFSEWTVFTIGFTASVGAFGIAFTIGFFAFEQQFRLVAFGFCALVIVFFFVKRKTFSLGFVLSEIRKCEAFTNTNIKNEK